MRSPDIENACMVVRTPVARAAPGERSHTRYRGTCDTCSQEGHPAAGAQAAHDSPVTNRTPYPRLQAAG